MEEEYRESGDNSGDNNGDNSGDNNDARKVLSLLEKNPYITANEMSARIGVSSRKLSRIMQNLRESGRIVRVGSSRKGYWEIRG